MSEIEKIKQYIDRTKMDKGTRYEMSFNEALTLAREANLSGDDSAFTAITLAFSYGKAKGYRAAKAEGRK